MDTVDYFGPIPYAVLVLTSTKNPRIVYFLYFFPSTIIMWYPNFVLTGGSV